MLYRIETLHRKLRGWTPWSLLPGLRCSNWLGALIVYMFSLSACAVVCLYCLCIIWIIYVCFCIYFWMIMRVNCSDSATLYKGWMEMCNETIFLRPNHRCRKNHLSWVQDNSESRSNYKRKSRQSQVWGPLYSAHLISLVRFHIAILQVH